MQRSSPIRTGAALAGVLLGLASSPAQSPANGAVKPSAAVSALPAAQPTGQAGLIAAAAPTTSAPLHKIAVNYTDGKLEIQATNASLNEILREVAHQTHMKITGGVADDRVFGTYGPSAPSVVLDALLEGTESNILLVVDPNGGSELILTPRRGGVTPPNPNAAQANESEDQNGPGQYVPPVRQFQAPVANGRGPVGSPAESQAPSNSDAGDGGGAKTPQQIYEQLQKTMQQRQAANPPPQ